MYVSEIIISSSKGRKVGDSFEMNNFREGNYRMKNEMGKT